MKPVRMWAGVIFLGLGVLGVLAITETLEWDKTVGEWWPVAIIGWGMVEMLSERRFDLGWSAVAAFGVTLLADEQNWAIEGLMWTLLFLFMGAAILIGPTLRKRQHETGHRQDESLVRRRIRSESASE